MKNVPKLSGIKKFSVADAFTTIGASFGLLAIFMFLTFDDSDKVRFGTSFIILALIMDGCDGAAARKFGTKHDYGRHIDSIADAISFCLAPSVLVYTVFFKGDMFQWVFASVVMVLIVSLGWTRLFKFSVEGYKLKNFSGLPTPANAFLIVIISHMMAGLWFIALPILFTAAILMVAPVPYPKVRGKTAIILAAAIGVSFLVMIVPAFISTSNQTLATYQVIMFLGLVTALAYVLGGPIYEKGSKKKHLGA